MTNGYNEQVINAEIAQIGPQGIPGEAATVSVGSVTTGAAGSYASVTNSGDSTHAVLDFVIPRGNTGAQGATGPQGIQGIQGETGNGISSIEKISSSGLTDTYRINLTNNTYYDFTVTNGSYISSIEKTGTSGLVDTYTITLTNGNTQTFTVTNGAKGDKGETGEVGNGILNILKMSTEGLVDNYQINFTNGTYFDYSVTNAKSITGISKTGSSGVIDTYTIIFNDNTSFSFPVTNGNGVAGVSLLSWVGLDKTYRMSFTNGTHFDYVVSNGAAGQVEWGGVAGVLSNQTDLQNALDDKANVSQLHALKSYADAGELLTDSEGLSDVINYAHSTFDRSKFTVEGSPVITDDGIASGFSSGNYLTLGQTFNLSSDFILKIGNIDFSSRSASTGIFRIVGSNGAYINLNQNWTTLFMYINNGSGSVDYQTNATGINSPYKIVVSKSGTSLTIDAFSNNEKVMTKDIDASSFDFSKFTNCTIDIGIGAWGGGEISDIDLKQFSITVDGVEVFSGNKTGTDTIKPSNFTAITSGQDSPFKNPSLPFSDNGLNITEDGIASGFSSSNYINWTAGYTDTNYSTLEINFPAFTTGSDITGEQYIMTSSAGFQFLFGINYNGIIQLEIKDVNGAMITITDTGATPTISANTQYLCKLVFNGSRYDLFVKGGSWTEWTSIKYAETTEKMLLGANVRFTGRYDYPNTYFKGSIDLNAFKIYVDGNLVYQPCLKIPYTESKTGSKIVNAIYRDRVNDMASQFGYAPYYTLSDTDFTLPQVEQYGLIARQSFAPSDKYIDLTLGANNSTYVAPANGYFFIKKGSTTAGQMIRLTNEKTQLSSSYMKGDDTSYSITLSLPVKKNDVVKVTYSASGITDYFRFIYAQGSESEAE